ncbi:hypothetical protein ADIS_3141 [Lunatimonas lonarensis]|uniref:Uncharacterized protein n=2 Tax=Lunatimonas lonarensis TaxID=1232681 RepID=R7ZRB5_9BACT|nr:hypothetical protein ADIS_3141 [Lunatimonas lonarensis]
MLIALWIFWSCSKDEAGRQDIEGFLLFQDTVLIDPKGDIINLKYGLSSPELSKDGRFLFHYPDGEHRFNKINLERLELEETLLFEKEGPNGMGGYIGGFSITQDEHILIWSYGLHAVFSQKGTKLRDLGLSSIADEFKGYESFPIRLLEHPNDPTILFGLMITWQDYTYTLLKFDLKQKSVERIPLPETERLKSYHMKIEHEGRPAGGFGATPMATTIQNDKLIISLLTFNEVYVYDVLVDSLYVKSWDSQLTGNQNEYKLPKTVQLLQVEEHRKKFFESIVFLDPMWDPVSKRYIRLSYKSLFAVEPNEDGEYEEIGADVFLTVLDANLDILKETQLPRLSKNPRNHFFTDNRIWLFENMDDELGFIRITVD